MYILAKVYPRSGRVGKRPPLISLRRPFSVREKTDLFQSKPIYRDWGHCPDTVFGVNYDFAIIAI